MGFTGKCRNLPDIQQHLLVRVIVAHLNQRPRGAGANAQFLFQLTGQGCLHCLAGLDLATGKLPKATLVFIFRTFGEQNLPIHTANNRSGYMNTLHARCSS